MFDIHIEEFYHDTFKALQTLYAAFPKKCNLFVEDIAGPDQPDEYGLHSDRFQCCFGAILWLEKEGFIRFESTLRQEAVDQASLTMKGLAFLSTLSKSSPLLEICAHIEPKEHSLEARPHITALKHIYKHGTSTQLALAMQTLFETYADY